MTFFTKLDGIANEYPVYEPVLEAIAELIPTNSPLMFTKAPPLFPGFTAASVWINDSIAKSLCMISIFRDFALTIPAVTVEFKLNGLPTANTHSPTLTLSEFANSIYGNLR